MVVRSGAGVGHTDLNQLSAVDMVSNDAVMELLT